MGNRHIEPSFILRGSGRADRIGRADHNGRTERFGRADRTLIGRNQILLLEAVARHGSITRAARAMSVSCKFAMDAIAAANGILCRPAVSTRQGGPGGGGTILTEDGLALIAFFRLFEAQFTGAVARMSDDEGRIDPVSFMQNLGTTIGMASGTDEQSKGAASWR